VSPPDVAVLDVVAWVCVVDGHLLVVRSSRADRPYLPGGKREADESDGDVLVREVHEELGVALDPTTLDLVVVVEDEAVSQPLGTRVRMACYRGEATGTPTPSAEIAALEWVPLDRPGPDDLAPAARQVLDLLRAEATPG
jgi:8-oxo-dGTP diphosphatase